MERGDTKWITKHSVGSDFHRVLTTKLTKVHLNSLIICNTFGRVLTTSAGRTVLTLENETSLFAFLMLLGHLLVYVVFCDLTINLDLLSQFLNTLSLIILVFYELQLVILVSGRNEEVIVRDLVIWIRRQHGLR